MPVDQPFATRRQRRRQPAHRRPLDDLGALREAAAFRRHQRALRAPMAIPQRQPEASLRRPHARQQRQVEEQRQRPPGDRGRRRRHCRREACRHLRRRHSRRLPGDNAAHQPVLDLRHHEFEAAEMFRQPDESTRLDPRIRRRQRESHRLPAYRSPLQPVLQQRRRLLGIERAGKADRLLGMAAAPAAPLVNGGALVGRQRVAEGERRLAGRLVRAANDLQHRLSLLGGQLEDLGRGSGLPAFAREGHHAVTLSGDQPEKVDDRLQRRANRAGIGDEIALHRPVRLCHRGRRQPVVGQDRIDQRADLDPRKPPVQPVAEPPVVTVAPAGRVEREGRIGSGVPRPGIEARGVHHAPAIERRHRIGLLGEAGRRVVPMAEMRREEALHGEVRPPAGREVGLPASPRISGRGTRSAGSAPCPPPDSRARSARSAWSVAPMPSAGRPRARPPGRDAGSTTSRRDPCSGTPMACRKHRRGSPPAAAPLVPTATDNASRTLRRRRSRAQAPRDRRAPRTRPDCRRHSPRPASRRAACSSRSRPRRSPDAPTAGRDGSGRRRCRPAGDGRNTRSNPRRR